MTVARVRQRLRITVRGLLVAMAVLMLPGAGVNAQEADQGRLAPSAVQALMLHGPWPQPRRPDPSNAMSGNAEAITLGRLLFFDARLSPSGRVACSSCHRPERGWSDGRRLGQGLATSRRNTLGLLDVVLQTRLGWDGAGTSLWRQSIRPLLDPVEMGSSAVHVRAHLGGSQDLAALYAQATGRRQPLIEIDAQLVIEEVAQALAAYQETIVSGRTAFDTWRDAFAAGRADAMQAGPLSTAARRGAVLFVGTAGCARCHSGPFFSDGGVHAVRRARGASVEPRRTPTLRNLILTAPYLSDGSAGTLADAIRAHEVPPRPQRGQIDDLVVFLRTLGP